MKIAICPFVSVEYYRGAEKWACTVANELSNYGHDVALRSIPISPSGERRVSVDEIVVDDVQYRERWLHDLSEFDVTYVVYHPLYPYFYRNAQPAVVGIHAWLFGPGSILTPRRNPLETSVVIFDRLVRRRRRKAATVIHKVTPISTSWDPDAVYIPNFVDVDRYESDFTTGFTALYTGGTNSKKGWGLVKRLAKTVDGIDIVATGEEVDERGIQSVGFLSEDKMRQLYSEAHLLLHPATDDLDSLSILEALAGRTPVLTTPTPTHESMFSDPGTAFLYANELSEFVEGVETVQSEWVNDRGAFLSRAERARELASTRHIDRVFPKLENLLRSCASQCD